MTIHTYPGVYIEELSSGVHTITGVATSITAFVGWAPQGPTDRAVLVQSWSDYARQFGGLVSGALLAYAVNHFFNNGGSQAYIVRLVDNTSAVTSTTPAAAAHVVEPGNGFTATAANPGQWANNVYGIRIVQNPSDNTRFSLLVVYTAPSNPEVTVENFPNLSISPSDPQSRTIDSVVNDPRTGSQFIRINGVGLTQPTPNPPGSVSPAYMLTGGKDGAVLTPATAGFHTALNADGSLSGGVRLLDDVSIFNLLCVPGETDATTISHLQTYCRSQRAFFIVDCRQTDTFTSLRNGPTGITNQDSINSAFYFPWVNAPDPLQQGRISSYPPCGFVAGIYAATDAARGVWKAPAGVDAGLSGASGLTVTLTDLENGTLNIQAINCLRNFSVYGNVVWGARTLRGNDQVGSEWKYIPIRRLALFLESSLYDGTQWVVFEPNDERLWSQIRLNVGAFMQGLFLQGAFQGSTPQKAYFVKCDTENNPPSSIAQGVVNILVGFAPLFPAEFVVIQIQQKMASRGQA
jgi:phage tail sheath protein FI